LKPALPSDSNLVLTVTPPHLVPEIERREREQAPAQVSEKERLVDLAVGQIQRFSYTKTKAAVGTFRGWAVDRVDPAGLSRPRDRRHL
jgi:hypothetical protein